MPQDSEACAAIFWNNRFLLIAGSADGPGMLWMLLEFVSALERALFNAFEGCCSCHPVADKTSSFFHTNRKVSVTRSAF